MEQTLNQNALDLNTETTQQVVELLHASPKIAVLLKNLPTYDEVVSSLALAELLKNNNKVTKIVCSQIGDSNESLDGVAGNIDSSFGSSSLVISFDYVEGDIEKISYKVEDGKFNLIVNSKRGIDPDQLSFDSRASHFDCYIVIGAGPQDTDLKSKLPVLESLESFEDKAIFVTAHDNLSISEQLVSLIKQTDFSVPTKTGDYLFSGLKSFMKDFTSPLSASAFESAAQCVKWIQGNSDSGDAPESWLGPKIYKGSSVVE